MSAIAKKTVDVGDAPEHLQELVALAVGGTEVVLREGRRPLVRLVPIPAGEGVRVAGLHPGIASTTPDFDEPLPDDFRLG